MVWTFSGDGRCTSTTPLRLGISRFELQRHCGGGGGVRERADRDAVRTCRRHGTNVVQRDAPETSTSARPLIMRTAFLTMTGVILSRRMMSAWPVNASATSARDSTSTIIG